MTLHLEVGQASSSADLHGSGDHTGRRGEVTGAPKAEGLATGISLFDNGDPASGRSEVFELDPRSGETVWSYTDPGFFSATRGSNSRLANGNTLITESDRGWVFEVTPEGETVWEFANPQVVDGERAAIWRMTRYDRSELSFLGERPGP